MLKKIAMGTAVLLLGGCALPVPLQIASWALDGISVLVSQKSVTDHGLSLVTDKDCAIWRGVVEGELCRDTVDQDILVAGDDTRPDVAAGFASALSGRSGAGTIQKTITMSNQQVVADRRQAGVVFGHAMSNTAVLENPKKVEAVQTAQLSLTTFPESIVLPKPELEIKAIEVVKWSPPVRPEFIDQSPEKGIYFVIGSFRNQNNAERLSDRHQNLSATLISAKLDGKKLYRVVVGPVQKNRIKTTHKVLRKEGLADTWAIRVNPADWTISARAPVQNVKNGEVARLSE